MMDEQHRLRWAHQVINQMRQHDASGRVAIITDFSMPTLDHFVSDEGCTIFRRVAEELDDLYDMDGDWNTIVVTIRLNELPHPWITVEQIRQKLTTTGTAVFVYQPVTYVGAYWSFSEEGVQTLCERYAETKVNTSEEDNHWIVARKISVSTPMPLLSLPRQDAASGGPWQIEDFTQTGGDQWVERRVCDYIASSFAPSSALDIGCGAGLFVQYLNQRGIETWGVEAEDLSALFPEPDRFIRHDLREPLELGRTFDLILCLEVAEHIDASFEETLFQTILRHSGKYLLFSAAVTGQEGHGHINLHTEAYWFTRLHKLGYRLHHDATVIARSLCIHPWYANNMSFWILGEDSLTEVPELGTLQPSGYIKRLLHEIKTIATDHQRLAESWNDQREHINELQANYAQQQQYISELVEYQSHFQKHAEEQNVHISQIQREYNTLQKDHEDLLNSWNAQQDYIREAEQKTAELLRMWNEQKAHIDELTQRHSHLIEDWERQRTLLTKQNKKQE